MSNIIAINELADKANAYVYGMATIHTSQSVGGMYTSIIFNETKASEDAITFCQVNQEDVKIVLDEKDIVSIEDKSVDGTIFYAINLKSGMVVNVFLFHEKDGEAHLCHALYGSYDEFLKELDLYDLEEMVGKTKKAFVSIADESTMMKHSYENVRLEEMDDTDSSRKLVFFNGNAEKPTDSVEFTLYDDAVNDIWLMNSVDGWDGLELRLHNQPFAKVRVSLLYK